MVKLRNDYSLNIALKKPLFKLGKGPPNIIKIPTPPRLEIQMNASRDMKRLVNSFTIFYYSNISHKVYLIYKTSIKLFNQCFLNQKEVNFYFFIKIIYAP